MHNNSSLLWVASCHWLIICAAFILAPLRRSSLISFVPKDRVADPKHCDANPYPYPYFTLLRIRIQLFTLMLSGSWFSSQWCKSATTGLQTFHSSILNVHASIASFFEPPQLLNFEFDADADQAFDFDSDPGSFEDYAWDLSFIFLWQQGTSSFFWIWKRIL